MFDVVFREDEARARCGDAAQNLSTLRRISLNLLKTETVKPKEFIRGKRIYAALDPTYLEAIIGLRQMEMPWNRVSMIPWSVAELFLDITMSGISTVFSNEANLAELLPRVDLVIGAVLVPGA